MAKGLNSTRTVTIALEGICLGESLSCLSLKQEAWSAENHWKVLPYLHL